jgi:YopX protein
MSEVKLKIWSKDGKCFYNQDKVKYIQTFTIDENGRLFKINPLNRILKIDYDDILLGSGLTDKDGDEIFVGHILELELYSNIFRVEVFYKNGCFWTSFPYGTQFLFKVNSYAKIIGHNLKNPELLTT